MRRKFFSFSSFCLFVSREKKMMVIMEEQAMLIEKVRGEKNTERSIFFYTTNKRFMAFSLAKNVYYFVLVLELLVEQDLLGEIL